MTSTPATTLSSGAENLATRRQPVWAQVVTHVLGTFCYLCVRVGQGRTRFHWCRRRDLNPRPTHCEGVCRSKYRGESRDDWVHLGSDGGSKSPILSELGAAGGIWLGPVSGQSPEAQAPHGWIASVSVSQTSSSEDVGSAMKADVIVTSARWRARRYSLSPRARDCEVCRLDGGIAQNDT